MMTMEELRGWFFLVLIAIGFSVLLSAAITSDRNPINAAWHTYVCANHMTDEERQAEKVCI